MGREVKIPVELTEDERKRLLKLLEKLQNTRDVTEQPYAKEVITLVQRWVNYQRP